MIRNLVWLKRVRVLQTAYIFAAFLVPFLAQERLTVFESLVVTSVTTGTTALLEVPSGYIADVFGRKLSLMLGGVFGVLAFVAYGGVQGFGPLAIAGSMLLGGCMSFTMGADIALAHDSCVLAGQPELYRRFSTHIEGIAGVAEAVSTLAAIGLGAILGLRSIMWVQAGIYALMVLAVLPLKEPRIHQEKARIAVRELLGILKRSLFENKELCYTLLFSAAIGNLTFIMVWLTPIYYTARTHLQPASWQFKVSYGVLWAGFLFSIMLFVRFVDPLEARLGHLRTFALLVVIGAVVYVALAGIPWVGAVLLIFGFYFVRAIQTPLLNRYTNQLIVSSERATVISLRRLLQQLMYTAQAPLIGWIITSTSLGIGLLVAMVSCCALAAFALFKMRHYHQTT